MIRVLPAILVAAVLLAGCRDTAPADTLRPGSLTVGTGGYVGMSGGFVSQSR
ncbi:hypothetical protein GXW78_17960 [Roseomonas terrae]|jgi:nitrous oxide reductase accessory protein NosL|uniref:Argininosuccinate lyase n=1 Tax=Neoroseomonas terrae TaxID=424799 RepID=A0ABS5EKK6_9PROT|nr:hypothetical protein [Neoroseomonas terrae]MBR0651561.1 hypothetical protein [Neoroseomonas terrae]